MAGDEQAVDAAALLSASVAGDRAAFAALVDLYRGVVWSVIRAHRLSPADADDVFQLVFLRLYERQGSIRQASHVGGWLATTTRRECWALMERAARRRDVTIVDDLAESAASAASDGPEAGLVADERRRAVLEAWASLGAPCRDLLRLLGVDPPLSYDDIAEALSMKRGSVGPTRQRCIDKLRAHPAVRRARVEP
ncbi:MAG: sigma-70 family RNA polymerase sigma factor [Actinobacteria bacterium]|nr:sigma-70 family RNA polymerase sigma factor [Actinomycetota bacterium]